MESGELNRVIEHLPGHAALLRVAPGFPVIAMTRDMRALARTRDGLDGGHEPLIFDALPEGPDAPGSADRLRTVFERVVRTRAVERHEQRYDVTNRATGQFEERHWSITTSPVLDDAGAVQYLLYHAEDTATDAGQWAMAQERERLSMEHEHRRRIYETALNSTPDFVYIFGTDHRAIYANAPLLKVWGVDEVQGKTWMDLGYEQWHADMHDRELAQVISTRAPIRGEIPFTGTNGRRIYDYIFAPVLDERGEVVAVAGTTRDMTERQAAEQIIREHADRLADADRAKDAFLATLSHELRNPLAPLRNGLEILRRTGAPSEREASVHAMMARQVDHLVRLVDDLMEVSRITRGQVSLQSEVVDLAEVVNSALETTRPLIDGNNHSIAVQLPDAPVHVNGDRVRLAQILSNLLNNAAKYSTPGSEIRVEATVEDGAVGVAVHDNGIGMDPDEIPQLFEMFTRGDQVKSSHQGGLGIGLALARRLATLHGGSLDASSEGSGRGSVFELRLPIVEGASETAPSHDPAEPVQLSLRVLMADDNMDVGQSLAATLRLAGADVRFEDNGVAVLDAYDDYQPDVAILDIGMPRVTGYDVARALRARGVTGPLIALTGWGQAADRERALAAGFSHHLVKPVSIPVLVDLLKSLETRDAQRPDAAAGA